MRGILRCCESGEDVGTNIRYCSPLTVFVSVVLLDLGTIVKFAGTLYELGVTGICWLPETLKDECNRPSCPPFWFCPLFWFPSLLSPFCCLLVGVRRLLSGCCIVLRQCSQATVNVEYCGGSALTSITLSLDGASGACGTVGGGGALGASGGGW